MVRFCRFELRTTDVAAARAFYTTLLGHDRAPIWPLHDQALARGARPHWLGHLGVHDVVAAAAAFAKRGATRLGPARPVDVGGGAVVLRDPGGAVVAVATPPAAHEGVPVAVSWHVLSSLAAAFTSETYREVCHWQLTERLDRGALGSFQQFSWQAGGPSVGAFTDITGKPDRHPHWLFFFAVESLESALKTVRAAGGLLLEPFIMPSGERACVGDDPQGAAFGLMER